MNRSFEAMAYWIIVPANRGRMTISALKDRFLFRNARFAFVDLVDQRLFVWIVLLLCMALFARKYGHISILHRSYVTVLRYPQVARGAVLFNVAGRLVVKFERITLDRFFLKKRRR